MPTSIDFEAPQTISFCRSNNKSDNPNAQWHERYVEEDDAAFHAVGGGVQFLEAVNDEEIALHSVGRRADAVAEAEHHEVVAPPPADEAPWWPAETTRLGVLARRVWQPVLDHEQTVTE